MSTIYSIAEQILRLVNGNPIISGRFHMAEIKRIVTQIASQMLKADHFSVNMPEGDTVPNNCMIFSYDNIPVVSYKTGFSKLTLPFIPVSLPRNVGVLHISKTDCIDQPFIPIPTSMTGIFRPGDILDPDQISYEVVGSTVVFNKDLPGLGINSLYLRLVGVDLSQLSDYDILPISADMESQLIQQIYALLLQAPPADRSQTNAD